MSRIEEALAKAAEMRDSQAGQAAVPDQPEKPPASEPEECEAVSERLSKEKLLVTANDPCSLEAEEFRKLKENIVKKTKRGTFKNMVMITSANVGEGKSVTAVNLAVSLAYEFDHTVLLVDADLRKPNCHKLFGLEPEIGLTDCLGGGRDISEAFIKVGIGRLTFLPAGHVASNPGELFSSKMMQSIFREMKQRYTDRYIIIDTPPVLPFAETRSMSRYVDCAVLVVKEGGVSVGQLQETVEALKSTDLIGAVYNQAKLSAGVGQSVGYYGYGG